MVTSVVVTPSVASVVPVSLEFSFSNLFTFMLMSNNDVLMSEELLVCQLLDVSGGSGVEISVASSVASSVPSVVISVVVTPSVASVMPVGVILLLSNFMLVLSNFTGLLVFKSEELFVRDGLDVDLSSTDVSVTSSVASSVSSVVTSVVITSAIASVMPVLVVLTFRHFNTLAFINRHSIIDHIFKFVLIE